MKFKQWLIGIGLLFLCSIIPLKAQLVGFSQYATGGGSINASNAWAIIPAELASQMNNSQGIAVSPVPVLTFLSLRGFIASGGLTLQSYYSTNSAVFTGAGLTGMLNTNQVAWIAGTNGMLGLTTPFWAVIHHVAVTNYVSVTNVIYGQTNITTKTTAVPLPSQIADEAVLVTNFPTTLNIITNTLSTITNANGSITTNSFTTTNNYIVIQGNPLQTVNPGDELYVESPQASISVASQGTVTATTFNSNAGILSGERKKPFLLTLTGAGTVTLPSTNSIDAVNSNFVP